MCKVFIRCLCIRLILAFGIIVCQTLFKTNISSAADMMLLRDVEIEDYLLTLCKPIFAAAGLPSDAVQIYIISGNALNAFVSNGMNVFIITPVITFSDNSDALLGIVAHEVGHIARGHLARSAHYQDIAAKSNRLLLPVLALTATIGRPDIAIAMALGMHNIGVRSELSHIRAHEEEADAAAFRYLRHMKRSMSGLYDIMEYFDHLAKQIPDLMITDPYLHTHPLPERRLERIRNANTQAMNSLTIDDESIEDKHRRVKAKIIGVFGDSSHHCGTKTSCMPRKATIKHEKFYQKYQEMYALWAGNKYKDALTILNDLMLMRPSDAFLYEFRAVLLSATNRTDEAMKACKTAVTLFKSHLSSENLLMQYECAKIAMHSKKIADLKNALKAMHAFAAKETGNSDPHHMMAMIYERLGDKIGAKMQLAEEAMIQNKCDVAIRHAEQIIKTTGSAGKEKVANATNYKYRAKDIIDHCKLVLSGDL